MIPTVVQLRVHFSGIWVIGSQCFGGVNYADLKGLMGPRLQMRALCSLRMSGFRYRLARIPVREEWNHQAFHCKSFTSGTVAGLSDLLCKGTSSTVTAWNRGKIQLSQRKKYTVEIILSYLSENS
jgi:hypothetical protein